MHSADHKKGFTLVELMVVIVIIGILATLGLVSFQNALKRSRDSKRMGDVKDIANAQEQLKGLNGNYSVCPVGSDIGGYIVPSDPGQIPANYTCNSTTTSFCVSADLEVDNNGNCSGCGVSTSTFGTVNNDHYCISSKQ